MRSFRSVAQGGWFRLALLLSLCVTSISATAEPPDWTGEWNSFWRSGRALMLLNQEGDRVFGFYEPGNGRIEGKVEGSLLTATWEQSGGSGTAVFALAPDGQSFTGRYSNGEYWNGARVTESDPGGPRFLNLESPRDTLNAVVTAANDAVIRGNAASVIAYEPVLFYEGGAVDERERLRRRTLLWRIVNLSTFRFDQAPSEADGDWEAFAIGPSGSDQRYQLRFRKREDGKWQVVVETESELEGHVARLLDDLGYDTFEDQRRAEVNSPRQTMKDFLLGMKDWGLGGSERALATLDLSFLPENLRDIEGPIVADYLKQILDRAGFVTWQEIPNDPDRAVPYIHYRHPVGNIAIVAKEVEEGEPPQWLFSAESLEQAPDLFDAVQDLPLAQGLHLDQPVSDFFRMREGLRDISPFLVKRDLIMENWIWAAMLIGLVLALVLARLAGWLITWLMTKLFVRDEGSFEAGDAKRFDWPVRLLVAGFLLRTLFVELGLAQSGFSAFTTAVGVVSIIGATLVVYLLAGAIGGHFLKRAQATQGYADEIVTSLVTGLAKLTIVIVGAIACADIIGLPYLGIITGLGVGGVALAFAARETVSNLLGGALLMADRPFSRGDLIETEGQWATIENVGLRSTRLRTFDDSILIIPNAQLSEKAIVNWGKRRRRKIQLEIGLTYDTPRDKLDRFVERLREIYEEQPRADKTECYVGLKSFGASSIDIHLWGYFKVYGYDAQVRAQHALIGDIIDLAKEIGVSFAFPTRTLHIAEGEDSRLNH